MEDIYKARALRNEPQYNLSKGDEFYVQKDSYCDDFLGCFDTSFFCCFQISNDEFEILYLVKEN